MLTTRSETQPLHKCLRCPFESVIGHRRLGCRKRKVLAAVPSHESDNNKEKQSQKKEGKAHVLMRFLNPLGFLEK